MGEQPRNDLAMNDRGVRQQPPRALPKAPTSEAVARRLWMNSNAVPMKRFDSADYFLNQYLEQRKQGKLAAAAMDVEDHSYSEQSNAPSAAPVVSEDQKPSLPPPCTSQHNWLHTAMR